VHPASLLEPPAVAEMCGKGGTHHAGEARLKAERLKGQLHVRGEESEWWGKGKGKLGWGEARGCFLSAGSSSFLLKTGSSASLKFVSCGVHKSSGGVHIAEMPGGSFKGCARAAMKPTRNEPKEPLPSWHREVGLPAGDSLPNQLQW